MRHRASRDLKEKFYLKTSLVKNQPKSIFSVKTNFKYHLIPVIPCHMAMTHDQPPLILHLHSCIRLVFLKPEKLPC